MIDLLNIVSSVFGYILFGFFINIILNLSQNNEIYLTTLIKGNLNNPNISFDKNSKFFQNSNSNENNIIEESVIQFLNNFFDFND